MASDKPSVLFAKVEWDDDYAGGVTGTMRYFKTALFRNEGCGEDNLYVRREDGLFHAGAGFGLISEPKLDVVFVAYHDKTRTHRAVAAYFGCSWDYEWLTLPGTRKRPWAQVASADVKLFKSERPVVAWPRGQGLRRWARCGGAVDQPALWAFYNKTLAPIRKGKVAVDPGQKKDLEAAWDQLDEESRARATQMVKRAARDQRLRRIVLGLWGQKCAACGLELSAGGDRFECEVAHIWEVHDEGQDSRRNTLPLCRTHHWAFDNHLWAIHPTTRKIVVKTGYRELAPLQNIHGGSIRGG